MVVLKPKLVSIIIVSWNSEKFIRTAVESCLSQRDVKVEVIMVDNASNDSTVELVHREFGKDVQIIENSENVGFARANNIGLQYSRGDIVLFLNPDARLAPNYLRKALSAFTDPEVAGVSGKILRFDEQVIDSAGQFLGRNRRPLERGYNEIDSGEYEQEGDCFSVCGAAALLRRKAIEDVAISGQFFDEDFFAFYEDLDVGWRLNLNGWRCRYLPDALVCHYRGGTRTQKHGLAKIYQIAGRSPFVQTHVICNRWFTIIKNDHFFNFILHLPWIIIQEIKTIAYLLFLKRSIIIPIYKTFCGNLSKMLKKRRIIRRNSRLGASTIRRRMRA